MRYVSSGVTAITSYTIAWQCISLEVTKVVRQQQHGAYALNMLKRTIQDYEVSDLVKQTILKCFYVDSGLIISLAFVHGRVGVSVYSYCGDLSRTTRRRIVLGAMF